MDERLLRFFVAIYEEKNLSRAAEKCFVSQPNISNGLKQLEELLGEKLFTRHKRGVFINTGAHYLYPIAKRILGELHGIPDLFKTGQSKTKVIIGIADSLPQFVLQKIFTQINCTELNIEWDVRPISSECDINILVKEWTFDNHKYTSLLKEDYVLCVPKHHPLSQKNNIEIDDLANEPFIHCPPCEAHHKTLAELDKINQKWNTIANCQTKSEVLTLLQSGLGLTFLPEFFAKENAINYKIVSFNKAKNSRNLGISYPKKSVENIILKTIIESLEKIDFQSRNFFPKSSL
ncbi:MAG: LysR family transcriptional regulator [Flavobacteriales bacterium]